MLLHHQANIVYVLFDRLQGGQLLLALLEHYTFEFLFACTFHHHARLCLRN